MASRPTAEQLKRFNDRLDHALANPIEGPSVSVTRPQSDIPPDSMSWRAFQEEEDWLRSHGQSNLMDYRTIMTSSSSSKWITMTWEFRDPQVAMLFKLTFS